MTWRSAECFTSTNSRDVAEYKSSISCELECERNDSLHHWTMNPFPFLSETCSHHTSSAMWAHGLILLVFAKHVIALEGPVGRLPAMGYNSWNSFQCNYNASLLEAQAKILYDRGLVDAGYSIFNFDDCYALKERNATGYMVANLTKFPEGINALSKRVHTYGMRLAAYGDNGYNTCGGYPGSYGHEMQDLETWYSWGMTYLKYDNCCE
jgi:hypothetical protein